MSTLGGRLAKGCQGEPRQVAVVRSRARSRHRLPVVQALPADEAAPPPPGPAKQGTAKSAQDDVRARLLKAAEYKRKLQETQQSAGSEARSNAGAATSTPSRADSDAAAPQSQSGVSSAVMASASPGSSGRPSVSLASQAPPPAPPPYPAAELPVQGAGPRQQPSASLLDALDDTGSTTTSGGDGAPPSAAPAMSARTEDEEIRASRQQRMAAAGLLGGDTASSWALSETARAAQALRDAGVRSGGEGGGGTEGGSGSGDEFAMGAGKVMTAEAALLSPEQFTLQKETAARNRGAEVLSLEREYKPTVTTWGVYERPKDISKAFGGGRDLKPSDSVMSKEEQEEYDRKLREKLEALRLESIGSPDAVQACEALTAKGLELMQRGALNKALDAFDEASQLLSMRTEAGGIALLQKAIVLDSLGDHSEALSLYRKLLGHRSSYVSKTARTMSFGFKAGDFLKADTITYAAKKEELDPLFTQLNGKFGWDTTYVATEQDKEADNGTNRLLSALLTALMLSPFVFLAKAVFF